MTPRDSGGSHVHMELDRRPRNLEGALVAAVLSLFGRQVFGKSLRETLHRIERPEAR